MLFKEALNTPCGLRYMYDALELQSGAGRRLLLGSDMMTSREEIAEHYAKLREFHDKADDRDAVTLQVKLARLRDISGTVSRLGSGALLDDVELFEVKSLLLLAVEVREALIPLGIGTVNVSVLCGQIVRILDPHGQKVPSFHVYDAYSEELAGIRAQMRRKGWEDEELLRKSQQLEERIRAQLSAELRKYAAVIWLTLETLAETDLLLAQSQQIKSMGLAFPRISGPREGVEPEQAGSRRTADIPDISGNAATRYEKIFNPEVGALLAARGREFQPVDVGFGAGPVTIIGANMGGKTVVLKTAGLCQLLFQFGFGIPAASAEIDIKEDVMFCIGEEDMSNRGLSSFASEVVCIDRVIGAAREGRHFLALVDEPARATNPMEGTALVEAFLKVMAGSGASVLVTTHYNLKNTPGRKLRVRGLVGGKMNYELEETGESTVPYEAVTIAESLGADREWIALAKEILKNNDK